MPSARCTPLKLGENRFNLAETINVLSKLKKAAAATLDFGKFAFLNPGIAKA